MGLPLPPRIHRFIFLAITSSSLLTIWASLAATEPISLMFICLLIGIPLIFTLFHARSRRQMLASIVANVLLVSVAISSWPLRLAYFFTRPSFDRIATQMRAGNIPNAPFSIGIFHIKKAEIDQEGIIYLWTNDDPAGATGFAQYSPEDLPHNLWSHLILDRSWQFISED